MSCFKYMYIESIYLVLEGKQRDIVFGFPWCIMCGGWFRISNRYFVVVVFSIFDLEK